MSNPRHHTMEYHFQTLGLSANASLEEIKSSYKKLAKTCHPDLHKNDGSEFRRIKESYDWLLSNQSKVYKVKPQPEDRPWRKNDWWWPDTPYGEGPHDHPEEIYGCKVEHRNNIFYFHIDPKDIDDYGELCYINIKSAVSELEGFFVLNIQGRKNFIKFNSGVKHGDQLFLFGKTFIINFKVEKRERSL